MTDTSQQLAVLQKLHAMQQQQSPQAAVATPTTSALQSANGTVQVAMTPEQHALFQQIMAQQSMAPLSAIMQPLPSSPQIPTVPTQLFLNSVPDAKEGTVFPYFRV